MVKLPSVRDSVFLARFPKMWSVMHDRHWEMLGVEFIEGFDTLAGK